MAQIVNQEPIAGFDAPVHRALTEPILLAGAPRAVAILNGTVSAAVGLGLRLWIAGLVLWALGHMAASTNERSHNVRCPLRSLTSSWT